MTLKTLVDAQAKRSMSNTFSNILEDNYAKFSKHNNGIVHLIQPLILAVGQRLARSQHIHLDQTENSHLYKVSQEVLKDFIKITAVTMALLDKELNYLSMSESWQNNPLLISHPSKPLGKNYKEVSPYQPPNWIHILEQALSGKSILVQEDLCTLPDGSERWMRWEIEPWEEDQDQIGGIVIFGEDITDQKTLQKQTDRLIKEKNELESFAYMCPHDLQAHIKTLSSFISFLAKEDHRRFDADVNEYYKFIFEALENMKNLIDDCLLHAQVHSELLIRFPQDLNEITSSTLTTLRAHIQSKKALIHCDPLPVVWCHKQTIKQVFENLITNALKFCVKSPRIHIYAEENDKEWIIHLQDNGIGMTAEDQQKLFQSFYRIHSKDKFPGTGLGLSFCKKIMELHEGQIWVTSAPRKGSTFSFSFPKQRDHNDNYAAVGNTTTSAQ